jgi:hypothetical protein
MPITLISETPTGSSTVYLLQVDLTNAETTDVFSFNTPKIIHLLNSDVRQNTNLNVLFQSFVSPSYSELHAIHSNVISGNVNFNRRVKSAKASGIRAVSTGTGTFSGKITVEVDN